MSLISAVYLAHLWPWIVFTSAMGSVAILKRLIVGTSALVVFAAEEYYKCKEKCREFRHRYERSDDQLVKSIGK